MRVPRILLLPIALALLPLVGCRTDPSPECSTPRIWKDSVGEHDERARIQVQWSRIQGGYDSLSSTLEGKMLVDRAAGSLARNEARYLDSVVAKEGTAMSLDGCVDWGASWVNEGFDRQAMATVLLRRLALDTGLGAVEFRLDTTSKPFELSIEASPSDPSSLRQLQTVRFLIDSSRIRQVQP